MAVQSMASCAGVTPSRLLSIFLVLCILLLTRDFWLPSSSIQKWRVPAYESDVQYASDEPTDHETSTLGKLDSDGWPIESGVPSRVTDAVAAASATPANDDFCSSAPDARRIMVIMKTGASELEYKLPTHLITVSKCIPEGHLILFSDMEQTFADYPVYDAVKNVSSSYKDTHEDFELYRKLQQYREDGTDLSKLKGDKSWNLDKWKFVPMVHATSEIAPDYIDWFVYIEADTSLAWVNLVNWLKTMNPRHPYYLGSQNVIGETTFGHGGSGVVVSRRAQTMITEHRERTGKEHYDQLWEEITSHSCCGDEVLARAFLEADVPLTPAWPVLQGEKIPTVDFTDRHWCTPPVAMHHVSPVEVNDLWRFQTQWVESHGWDTPYLWRDIYHEYVETHIQANRTSWNNISDRKKIIAEIVANEDELNADWFRKWDDLEEWEQRAVQSFDDCAEACVEHEDWCVQWQWEHGRCYLGPDVRLGSADDREDSSWASGWHLERIETSLSKREPCQLRWNE